MNSILTQRTLDIKSCNFRYYDNRNPVYFIQRKNKNTVNSAGEQIYTFPITVNNVTRNALIGFSEKSYCKTVEEQLHEHINDTYRLDIGKNSLKEFKYLSYLLKSPLIVVVDSYCNLIDKDEQLELFYHHKPHLNFMKEVFEMGKTPDP